MGRKHTDAYPYPNANPYPYGKADPHSNAAPNSYSEPGGIRVEHVCVRPQDSVGVADTDSYRPS